MRRPALISATLLALAAIGALAIIVFNITQRGHYIFCGSRGCLTIEAALNFSLPFAFLFVKHVVILFGFWLGLALILKIGKDVFRRDVAKSHDKAASDWWLG